MGRSVLDLTATKLCPVTAVRRPGCAIVHVDSVEPAMTNPSGAPTLSGSYDRAQRGKEDLASFLRQVYLLARRRIRLIMLLVIVGTGLAAYFAYSRTPVYT